MSRVSRLQSPLPSPTSSLTYFENRSDPMDFEPRGSSPTICSETRFSPYPKRLSPSPGRKHPHAILFQNRGLCDDISNKGAMRIFTKGIRALPNDILRSSVCEKYASTERSRLRLLLATWDIEVTKRRLHTLERIQRNLERAHSLTESEFKFWLGMYSERGLPGLKEDEMFYNTELHTASQTAEQDATELSAMVEQATQRGLNIESPGEELEASASDEGDVELGEGTEAG